MTSSGSTPVDQPFRSARRPISASSAASWLSRFTRVLSTCDVGGASLLAGISPEKSRFGRLLIISADEYRGAAPAGLRGARRGAPLRPCRPAPVRHAALAQPDPPP